LTSGTNITLDSTSIDAYRFDTKFIVSTDGTILKAAIPEPTILLGGFLLGLAFLRRK